MAEIKMTIDIGNEKVYPSEELSNFTCHKFIFDGVQCNSMEGFLQSLKFKSEDIQKQVCLLIGKKAKFKGKKKKWWKTQTLYWKGQEFQRQSIYYNILISRAFNCIYKDSESFREALKFSIGHNLIHSIGKNDKILTILTNNEFISNLHRLRNLIKNKGDING